MRTRMSSAFTLVELLVVIAIIGTLVGLLLPAVQSSREASRAMNCSVNLTQIQKATQMYESNKGSYPGYVNELGYEGSGQKRVSWVVLLLPYLEKSALWESWNTPGAEEQTPYIDFLLCPSNPTTSESEPALSYVANAGFIENEPDDICEHILENPGNGIFFDRTRELGPQDQREQPPGCGGSYLDPIIQVNFAYVQSGDGTTSTMMYSENLSTVTWAYSGANIGALDRKWNFGFCWGQPNEVLDGIAEEDDRQKMRINGNKDAGRRQSLAELNALDAFASSHHPSGVNVAFAGGNVRKIDESIHPLIYAQLMTSNRRASDLKMYKEGSGFVTDADLPQPADNQY